MALPTGLYTISSHKMKNLPKNLEDWDKNTIFADEIALLAVIVN